jgi:hypothetical protein
MGWESEIRDPEKILTGSRGKNKTGSRIRFSNTDNKNGNSGIIP